MADEIIDIIHNISYQVHDAELDKAIRTVEGNIKGIENLTKRQIRLAQQYNRTAVQDNETRARLSRMINQNTSALNYHKKSLEQNIISNKRLTHSMEKELGIIGTIEQKLKLLQAARRRATSDEDIRRYDNLINQQRTRLNNYNANPIPNQSKGLLSSVSGVSRLLPAVGGALSIATLGNQVKDVTQRFESYRTTLRNTFQSSIKANEEFTKIKTFAEKTPFAVDELTSSFIKLVNRGFTPTYEELTNLGDLAASQGKSFDQLVEAILDAQTNEYERLKEFGIRAKTVGDSVTLTFKGVEKQIKKTDEEAIRKAILSFGQMKGVAGGMNAQAQTLGGTISNLGDSFDGLFSAIGSHGQSSFQGLLNSVKETVDWFTKMIETSPVDSLREQRNELNLLVGQLIIANNQEEVRSSLMSEIASKYPEYLNLIDAERSSTEQLSSALSVLNQEYENKIRLALISEEQNRITEKQTRLIGKQREAIKALLPELAKYGYTEVSFSALSPSEQQRVGNQILKKSVQNKGEDLINELSTSTREFAGERNLNKVKQASEFQKNWENFNSINEKLNKERLHQIKLTNAQNESYIKGLKETLAQEEEELKLMKKQGANQNQILAQEKLIQGIRDKINSPTKTKTPANSSTGTKKTKSKTHSGRTVDPNKEALKVIEENYKTELEKEKQALEKIRKEKLTALQNEEIDRITYNEKMQDITDSHNAKLLLLEINYAKQRIQYIKGAEKEASQTRIAEIQNSIIDLSTALKERAEKEIKALIDSQRVIDDELFKLSAESLDKEIKNIQKGTDVQLEAIDERNKELIRKHAKLTDDLNNPELSANAIEQLKLVEEAQKKNEELRLKVVKDSEKRIRETRLKYVLEEIKELENLAVSRIDHYTEKEQAEFDKKYLDKLRENENELEKIRNQADENDNKNLSKNKKLKLAEEKANKEVEIAKRAELTKLFIIKTSIENQLAVLKAGYDDLADEEKESRQKQIDALNSQLSTTQNSIKKGFDGLEENPSNEKCKWSEKDEKILNTFREINAYVNEVTGSVTTFTEVLQNALDLEISIRERRVERIQKIAERGNAEILQLEEQRLQKAQAQQEKYARQQIAINSAQQISASLVAVAEAAKRGGGFLSIAAVLATISALATGYAMAKSLSQDSTGSLGFKDGVVNLYGPGTETSDSIPARLSKGESVITAKGTRIGDNAKILEMMNNNVAFSLPNIKDVGVTSTVMHNKKEVLDIKNELAEIKTAIENQKSSSVIIDADGLVAMSNAVNIRKMKRDLL
ncbi:hypothetical protein QP519_10480 [Weeksella virosa]|uniref:hypothetical protein n=1 Tax=Weeksella virosa TaxID=1014 RepID=UPI00255516A8|nr:hypothetical protein [Weeksella virosa]MDK7375960.1 hypothetical protein [Weeksella virosa]